MPKVARMTINKIMRTKNVMRLRMKKALKMRAETMIKKMIMKTETKLRPRMIIITKVMTVMAMIRIIIMNTTMGKIMGMTTEMIPTRITKRT